MHPVIAVRRIACACDGCKRALRRPIATRYTPHDDCARFGVFERTNDWKLVTLKPEPPKSAPKRGKKGPTANDNKRALAAQGALVVPQHVHDALLEELDRRDRAVRS
mmetsp:Transcript_15446/g.41701  ORF Transcript_15446/g.41701 Transcript_15446/m.41701 type:complete len:107 (-) Transcript_15446:7-327(-)